MTRPPLFRDLTFAAARSAAQREGKLLLIDVMGDWCAPCRWMDETTWRDPEVEAWIEEKAIAIQVDSEDPLMTAFGISAVPTLMLFRGDLILDRVSGARSSRALLDWLARAERGEREVEQLVEVGPNDIHGRRRRAHLLMQHDRFEEAASELAWIWEHCLEVSMSWFGVRHSFLVQDMQQLVAKHPAVAPVFREIRDRTEWKLPDEDALRDWVQLNLVLGDHERTLVRFDRVKADFPPAIALDRQRTLLDALVFNERWADIGRVLLDPIAALERHFDGLQRFRGSEFADPKIIEHQLKEARSRAHIYVRSLRAAARLGDAEATAKRACELDPSPEMEAAVC